MKTLIALALAAGLSSTTLGDIHDPPSNDHGPTRKLGRGIGNVLYATAEIPVTIATINDRDGNSAAASYGVVRGFGRAGVRTIAGFLEILTFPAPAYRQSYAPMLPSDIPWIHAGYAEFPPELGFESKYHYGRMGPRN